MESAFNANLEAILNSSSGEILSKPSVMVMDGRQARIQIGQHIPITRTTSSTSYTSEDIDSNNIGINIIKFPFGNSEYLDSSADADSALESMAAYLGGNSMPSIISGEPPERIMVCYDDGYESDFRTLLEFLKNKIDIAASQVMIEALVIEINSDELEELGINLSGQGENFIASTPDVTNVDGSEIISGLAIQYSDVPLLDEDGVTLESAFNANLEAILNSSSGEILSKPSVMVMDGRQARIQIGQHIPITRTTSSTSYTLSLIHI